MTPEVIALVVTAAGVVVTTLAGMAGMVAWLHRDIDRRFEAVDRRFERIEDDLTGIRGDLTEVKIAIARLEGPTPRLITATR